jgi:hypothetical protein
VAEETLSGHGDPHPTHRAAFIDCAQTLLAKDPRLIAGWLEGSLAAGTADPYSDVDLYLAARDDAIDAVWNERLLLIERVRPILASADMTFAGGLRAVGCLVEGPIKVDVVFLADRDLASYTPRAVQPLWGAAPSPSAAPADTVPSDEDVRRALDPLVRLTLQGGMWPIRVLGRGQWDTFVYIELLLIETAIVPLLLLETDPRALQRNQFSRSQRLSPNQRAEIESLANAVIAAAATHDPTALLPPHLAIYRQICRLARAAFTRYSLDFPARIEEEMTAFYEREWPRSPLRV